MTEERPAIGARIGFGGVEPLDLTDPLVRRRYLLAWLDRTRLDGLGPGEAFERDHVPGEFTGWDEGLAAEVGRIRVWRSDAARKGRQQRMRRLADRAYPIHSDGEDLTNDAVLLGPPPGTPADWQRELDQLPLPAPIGPWRAEREALLEAARSAVLADLGDLVPDRVKVEEAEVTYGPCVVVFAAGARPTHMHNWEPNEWDTKADALRHLADQAQEVVIEAVRTATGDARPWPECPEHPDHHPMKAREVDGEAVWMCPRQERTRIPIGRLHDS